MSTLEDRRAVVCGSTQGIGRACAVALARAGAAITLVARNARTLEEVRGALPADHGQAHGIVAADFGDWERVRDAAARMRDEVGAVHVLVNNSGGPPAGPASSADPTDFARAFAQHLLCSQALVQAFVPTMREARFGRIVNIISTSVITPIKGLGVSNTIRGAVANWARTIAAELAPDGITVNNVLPGFTATDRLQSLIDGRATKQGKEAAEVEAAMKASVPAGRFGTAEEIAAVVAFLASPAAAYVNGVNLPVDGGRLAAQ